VLHLTQPQGPLLAGGRGRIDAGYLLSTMTLKEPDKYREYTGKK